MSKYGRYRCAVDGQVYKAPDPEFAYRLLLSHDIDAVRGRWPHLTEYGVGKILQQGKRLVTGSDGTLGRSQEELARIVEAVFRLGSPTDAARELGLHESAVRSALLSAGHKEYPRLSAAERGRRGHASRNAARSTTP